ncbi:MAG: phosphotransferase [Acidimicrobiales bacterium]
MADYRSDGGAHGEAEMLLLGGSMTEVVRVGDTVRRPVGRWTPAVHDLLRHLEDVGFDGAPRVLGFDDRGREVLTYLPSDDSPRWSRAALEGAGRLVRRLHDALADFVPPSNAVWRHPSIGQHAAGGPIGHNDLQPANTVYADGVPYGFIDWDLAGPASPQYDVALAAITFTPLHHGERFRPPGCPNAAERIARLRAFCDAYGVEDRLALLDAVERLQREDLREMREFGPRGISPYQKFFAGGEYRFVTWDHEWLLAHRGELERALLDAG